MSENINTTAEQVVEPVKLTRAEKLEKKGAAIKAKIEALTAELNEIVEEQRNLEAFANIASGTAIRARVGRGENAREVLATVIGVREDDEGSRQFKIFFGEGMDAETLVISQANVIAVL